MKKIVGLIVLIFLIPVLAAGQIGGFSPFSGGGGGAGTGTGDMTEADYSTGGIIKNSKGGTGQNSSAWNLCFPYLTLGVWGCDGNTTRELREIGALPVGGKAASAGVADTATALAANGSNCSPGYAPLGVDAGGAAEGCWQVTPAAIDALLGDGNQTRARRRIGLIIGTDVLAPGGTAAAATALAANGSNCSSGYAALGVDASGAAEGCWQVTPTAIGAAPTLTGHGISAVRLCPTTSNSGTAEVCNTTPTFTPIAGDSVMFQSDIANTEAFTLNVNSLGAKSVVKRGAIPLIAGDIRVAPFFVMLTYDGTNWEMEGQGGHAVPYLDVANTFTLAQTFPSWNLPTGTTLRTVASAATPDLGNATSEYVEISGAVTITGFVSAPIGTVKFLRFTGAPQLTYNVTSFILPGTRNINVQVGARAIFISLGAGNWVCMQYLKNDGHVLGDQIYVSHSASENANNYDMYGQIHRITGAYTVTLPAAVIGMNARFRATTAAIFCVDVNAADHHFLGGNALTNGNKICSDGFAGSEIQVDCPAANTWEDSNANGLFVDSGA